MKLIIGLAVIWVVVIFFKTEDFIYVALTVFIFLIGYFGSRQGAIFTDNRESEEGSDKRSDKGKYEKSTLTKDKSKEFLRTLKVLMDTEKPYLETKISLKDISERLKIHPNHLSQVINEELNINLYDFVNGYRVEEFKKRLTEDESRKFTLLAHAYDSGYSSKSSFNEVFKKFTGLTPSQYQKQLYS
ncbi:MAG: helix-turn-helix transcriptional regulator [Cytophagales bacterium]|nr:helix-turn-helix transcriptional regulator [Cytophagales bacterium]